MNYDVIITANGASIDQLDAASQLFRQVLEDGIGGLAQFSSHFRAYTLLERGMGTLTPQDDLAAKTYLEANSAAERAVRALLGNPNAVILVRLKH